MGSRRSLQGVWLASIVALFLALPQVGFLAASYIADDDSDLQFLESSKNPSGHRLSGHAARTLGDGLGGILPVLILVLVAWATLLIRYLHLRAEAHLHNKYGRAPPVANRFRFA